MIGRVHKPGANLTGLLQYLFGPGRKNEHESPRLVAGWRHPADLDPPLRADGTRDFSGLVKRMKVPLALLGEQAPGEHVYHVSLRAADSDPVLGDGAWTEIAAEVMDRTGLCPRGQESRACPWIAAHHGDNHVHIVAVLARLDARSYGGLHNDYHRIREALAGIEEKYGLEPTVDADRTASVRPTPAEVRKAADAGLSEPARVTLQRHAAAAAAAARTEAEFFAGLGQRGVRVRLHRNPLHPDTIFGYSAGLPGDLNSNGDQMWFPGRRLAPDLALRKLRARWPAPVPVSVRDAGRPRAPGQGTGPGAPRRRMPDRRDRLSAVLMNAGASRAALRRQVAAAAVIAGDEDGFFRLLEDAGLLVAFRLDPGAPRGISGYMVSLPGLLHHGDRRQLWFGGRTLDRSLSLPALRGRWQRDTAWTRPPGTSLVRDDDETAAIYSYATAVARDAAARIGRTSGRVAADIAWAASDLITSAAQATGNPELQRAADGFGRAGRFAWGRVPPPTDHGLMLRTAAWLIAGAGSCDGAGRADRRSRERDRAARAALITALADLARSVARLRAVQNRILQEAAALDAAGLLDRARSWDRASTAGPKTQANRRGDRTGRPPAPSR